MWQPNNKKTTFTIRVYSYVMNTDKMVLYEDCIQWPALILLKYREFLITWRSHAMFLSGSVRKSRIKLWNENILNPRVDSINLKDWTQQVIMTPFWFLSIWNIMSIIFFNLLFRVNANTVTCSQTIMYTLTCGQLTWHQFCS